MISRGQELLRSKSCRNDDASRKENLAQPGDCSCNIKVAKSKSIPDFLQNESISLEDFHISKASVTQWPSDLGATFVERYGRRSDYDARRMSRMSLISRMTGYSVYSFADQFKSTRAAFIIILASFFVAMVIVSIVILVLYIYDI